MGKTVLVELVIDRPGHEDLLYGTGQVWDYLGDVKPVPEEAWARMAIHADVYRRVQAMPQAPQTLQASVERPPAPAPAPSAPAPAPVVPAQPGGKLSEPGDGSESVQVVAEGASTAGGSPDPDDDAEATDEDIAKELDSMEDADIHAIAKSRAYKLHPRVAGKRLRKDFLAAAAAVRAPATLKPKK